MLYAKYEKEDKKIKDEHIKKEICNIEEKYYTFRCFLICICACIVSVFLGYGWYLIDFEKNNYKNLYESYSSDYYNLKHLYCENEDNVFYAKYCE